MRTSRLFTPPRTRPAPVRHTTAWQATPRHRLVARHVVGGLFLVTGGVHLGLVAADPQVYGHFADAGLLPVVREGWAQIVMANPAFWGLLLMAGEIVLGTLLLVGGRAARWGWAGVIAFHALLLLFGFGIWLYAGPALVALLLLARLDLRQDSGQRVRAGAVSAGSRRRWSGIRRAGP